MRLLALVLLVAIGGTPVQAPSAWTQFRLAGSNDAVLPGSLRVSWHVTTLRGFSSSPTLVGDTLYIGDNAGEFFALDPATGKARWTYRVENPLMSAPIVYGDAVIVGEGNENTPSTSTPSRPTIVGTPPNALIALDRNTGALLWRVDLSGTAMPSPAILDGILVHHNGAGIVRGFDPATGRSIFNVNLHSHASMTAATPVSSDDFITGGVNDNAVFRLRARDGSIVWRSNFTPIAAGLGDCPFATDRKRIYCDYIMPPSSAVPVQTERVAVMRAYALDAATGKRLWDVELERGILPKRNEGAIPLLVNGILYVGSAIAPAMHAVDAASGRLLWRTAARGAVKGGIAERDGVLYYGDLGGYLWAVNAKSGAVIGVKNMHAPFNVGSPLIAGDTLIIGSRGGTLLAVPLDEIRTARDR
jgi:outer membrane protein assembly factor BamB